ncbi:MAG: hypothetical protein ACRD5L_04635 [Bryobacteraceae bacterium]
MPDDHPIRTPPAAQIVASPPRREARPADPCAMVIFGAGGDLTRRLVVPALYNLSRTKVLPEKFALIGVDLAAGTAESWRDHLYDMLKSFVGNATAEFDIDRIDEAAWRPRSKAAFQSPWAIPATEVKSHASAVTDSNENEGFAKAVRKFVLEAAAASLRAWRTASLARGKHCF